MTKMHISDKGEMPCAAKTPESCPVKRDGEPAPHFRTKTEAREFLAKEAAGENPDNLSAKTQRKSSAPVAKTSDNADSSDTVKKASVKATAAPKFPAGTKWNKPPSVGDLAIEGYTTAWIHSAIARDVAEPEKILSHLEGVMKKYATQPDGSNARKVSDRVLGEVAAFRSNGSVKLAEAARDSKKLAATTTGFPAGTKYRKNPTFHDLSNEDYAKAWADKRLGAGDADPKEIAESYVASMNNALKSGRFSEAEKVGIQNAKNALSDALNHIGNWKAPEQVAPAELKEGDKFSFPAYRPNSVYELISQEVSEDTGFVYLRYRTSGGKIESGVIDKDKDKLFKR